MVCTREPPLSERALKVLEVLLRGQRHYKPDVCAKLRPALLQAVQRLSVENHGLGQENSEQGKRQKVTLEKNSFDICGVLKMTEMKEEEWKIMRTVDKL